MNETKLLSARGTINIRCRINPREICYLTAILEAYSGYCVVRVENPKKGIVQIWIAPDFYQPMMDIINEMKLEIELTILEEIPPI